ncbi:MAG: hypothetical protein GF344_14370 [Chitinivibrionales bacterium]|nr:hypothetical protein [Chitinivibrionales bacterium]MBD3357909.1 hypothetical protein [Chitinivibrionales bacterium]
MAIPEYIGTMRTESAVVLKTSKSKIRVALKDGCTDKSSCRGCTACGHTERTIPKLTFPVENASQFSTGQEIKIRRLAVNEGLAAGIVFGIPLLAAVAAIVVSQLVKPDSLESPETVVATIGALGLGIVTAIAVETYISRRHPVEVLEKGPPRRENT